MPRIPEMDTSRLRLRRQAIEDAPVFRHLWTERDERVPPHRRLDPDGRPDVDDIRAHIRDAEESSLLTVERIDTGDPIGYCGLVYGGEGVGTEPELAFELLRAEHNRGYATEAAQAVLTWADGSGFDRVWAGVWEWNLPSRRVLEKLGFVESGRERPSSAHGRNILTVRTRTAVPRIVSGEITLRPFEPDDLDAVIEASTDPSITSVTSVPVAPGRAEAAAWVTRQHQRLLSAEGYSYAIERQGECVGQIGLWLRDIEQGRGTVGYWIRPGRRGRGTASMALRVLSEWAWTIEDIQRLQAHVEPGNEASCRTIEHAGFVREGLLRSWQTIAGSRRDMFVYALVRPDAPGTLSV